MCVCVCVCGVCVVCECVYSPLFLWRAMDFDLTVYNEDWRQVEIIIVNQHQFCIQ